MGTQTLILGLDCAVATRNRGLAVGSWDGTRLTVLEATHGDKLDAKTMLQQARAGFEGPVLVAMDAPLGWPAALGEALGPHSTGQRITHAPNDLFRRYTDTFIKETLGKTPLEVGADRIARTAHAALEQLHGLRTSSGLGIEPLWTHQGDWDSGVIEVYPAATLTSMGMISRGYKKSNQADVRARMLDALRDHMTFAMDTQALLDQADILDAVICLLAGVDFLTGRAMAPPSDRMDLIRKEGWVWVRPR